MQGTVKAIGAIGLPQTIDVDELLSPLQMEQLGLRHGKF